VASATDSLHAELLQLAITVAAEAGELLLAAVVAPVVLGNKSSITDLVTETDRASEALIVDRLLTARPDDGLVGEEGSKRPSTSGVTWVIDPLDGTVNFSYGYPAFCVSIAAEVDGRTAVGVVLDPLREEMFTAVDGGGAWLGERRLAVRPAGPPLELSLIATGFAYVVEDRVAQAEVIAQLMGHVRDIRRGGSAALDLCWVGAGRLDGYFERGTMPWDVAAGGLVAIEAGAAVGTLSGEPFAPNRTNIAARPDIAEPLRDLLRRCGAVE
jgi:myo-inositol-1(or 4)-monophosphatase